MYENCLAESPMLRDPGHGNWGFSLVRVLLPQGESPDDERPTRHDVESRGGYYSSSESVPRCQLGTVMMLKVGVDTLFE